MQVFKGGNEVFLIQGKKIVGINIVAHVMAAIANAPIGADDFDANGLQLEVTLKRNGVVYTVVKGLLRILGMESNLRMSQFKFINRLAAPIILVPAAPAVKEEGIVPIYINFGSVIDISGTDELAVRIQSFSTEYGVALDGAASYVDVNVTEAFGVENALPCIIVEGINTNQSQFDYRFGDNVKSLSMINLDKGAKIMRESIVLKQLSVTSDRYNANDMYEELLAKNIYGAVDETEEVIGQSRVIFDLQNLMTHGVNVSAQFEAVNVVGGMNYWVVRKYIYGASLPMRAQTTIATMQKTDAQRIGSRG